MPSSHSQFMWFFSVYSFLFLYLRMHQTNNARFLDLLWRHVLSICLVTVALLVSYSRVYLLYHTWSQVLYGGVAGSVMAIAWFAFTQEILTPLFPRIAAWPISEFFLIRDTSLIPNILWFEYTVTRAEARNRQRKLGTKLQWLRRRGDQSVRFNRDRQEQRPGSSKEPLNRRTKGTGRDHTQNLKAFALL